MRFDTRFALALLLCAATSARAAESKPFTTELMLQNESIGEVRFSPDGSRLYLEKQLPYREKQRFDRLKDWNRSLSILSSVDVQTGKKSDLQDSSRDRTWYLGNSPSGQYTLFGYYGGDAQRLGILDETTGEQKRLDLPASSMVLPLIWLSEYVFVTASMNQEQQDMDTSYTSYPLRKLDELSARTWKGETSVKVIGAGKFRIEQDDPPVAFVQVDARTGKVSQVNSGTISIFQSRAPGGQRVAYLRKAGSLDLTGVKADAIHFSEYIYELNILDVAAGNSKVAVCGDCSIDDGTLRWSPSGQQLYYSVRELQQEKLVHHHFIYDVKSGKSVPFKPEGLVWDTEVERAMYLAPLVWLDEDHFALRTRNKEAGQFENQGFRWHLVTRAGAVLKELTAGLATGKDKKEFKQPVAAYRGGLLMVADGQLWHLGTEGPRSLTATLGVEVDSWCAAYAYWRAATPPRCDALGADAVIPQVSKSALERDRIALRVMGKGVFTGEFVFLNLATGQSSRLKRPTEDSVPLEVSALSEAVVFHRTGKDGDEVLLTKVDSKPVSLHRFNTHLAGVKVTAPVLLTRREAGEDEDRNDWLLLPPDHKPGQRHPLLVYFYPDQQYRNELLGDDIREVSFLNKNIPTAHGYAVLLATMKISDYGKAGGNPMAEMHEQLIRAAENAVAKGYVDPDRWAIMGHSYGGYGTNGIITYTSRFKAAIALDGLSNLTSGYAIGMNQDKAYAAPAGIQWGAKWSEGGQGRMGAPPWENAQRYVDNSPLFRAKHINTPLMLMHGDLDWVNVNESEQMFVALQRQGKDVQLVRYWGEGHAYSSPGNISDMWNRIFEFLDKTLGAEGSSPKAAKLQ